MRRLTQIRQLQDEGLNLAAIAKVLADGTLTRALVEPFVVEEPVDLTIDELLEQLGIGVDDPAVERALELGFVELLDDGRVRVAMPELLRASRDMSELGVPLVAQLEAVAIVRRATAEVAAAFMELAEEHLVARVAVEAGGDPDQIRTIVERLRTVAVGVTDALFTQAMIDQLQRSLGQTSPVVLTAGRRLAGSGRRPRSRAGASDERPGEAAADGSCGNGPRRRRRGPGCARRRARTDRAGGPAVGQPGLDEGARSSARSLGHRLAGEVPDHRAQLELGVERQAVVDAPEVAVGVDEARGRPCGRCCWPRCRTRTSAAAGGGSPRPRPA